MVIECLFHSLYGLRLGRLGALPLINIAQSTVGTGEGGQHSTTTVSQDEVAKALNSSLSDGWLLGTAVRSVRQVIQASNPDAVPRLVICTINSIATLSAKTTVFAASRISPSDAPNQIWNVSVEQLDAHDPSQHTRLADLSCVFELMPDSGGSHPGAVETRHKDVIATSPFAPKSGTNGSEKFNERRRQIFEGACSVIAKKGFGNASIREIAKEAGLSVPLMYKYIKDKDDILYLITSECMEDLLHYFEENKNFTSTPEANIKNAIDRYVDYIGQNRRYINLVYSETRALNAENRQKIFSMEKKFMRYWKAIIDDGIAKGEFRPTDSELTANYIYFLCTVWSLRHWSIGHFDVEEIKQSLFEFVLLGLTSRE